MKGLRGIAGLILLAGLIACEKGLDEQGQDSQPGHQGSVSIAPRGEYTKRDFFLAALESSLEENSSVRTIRQNLADTRRFSIFLKAAQEADQPVDLREDVMTVFAPIDEAFERVPRSDRAVIFETNNRDLLQKLVMSHTSKGVLRSAALIDRIEAGGGEYVLVTSAGIPLIFTRDGETIFIQAEEGTKVPLLFTDLPQKNGVVHVIDTVLTQQTK